ncbi:MAG: hypothetical protein WCG83_05020 [Candidatus Peregrinibacteria bacterium]
MFSSLLRKIGTLFPFRFQKIREINRRYAKPRIHTSPGVSLALLFLRLYLIFLVAVLCYKFVTIIR